MKNIIFICLVCIHVCSAQQNQVQDTIYANEFYNIGLFFPDPVKQGVVGAAHFTFSYNEVEAQRFGLLKATEGEDSNLLVVTQEGDIYSYILSYRKRLPKLNYFINKVERIGEEVPKSDGLNSDKATVSPEKEVASIDSASIENLHFQKAAEYYLNLKPEKISRENKGGIELAVEGFRYYRNHVFVILELENHSGVSLEVDYLRLFMVKGNNKRSGSYQKLEQERIWSYHEPEVVYHGQSVRFVLAFSKFIPGNDEKILLELRERQGNRLLKLKFDPKLSRVSAKL